MNLSDKPLSKARQLIRVLSGVSVVGSSSESYLCFCSLQCVLILMKGKDLTQRERERERERVLAF